MPEFVFGGYTPAQLAERRPMLAEVFARTGLLYFPGVLKADPLFDRYVNDLRRATDALAMEAGIDTFSEMSVDEKFTRLFAGAAPLGKFLADLGTQPAKLVSANVLKFRPEFVGLAQTLLGSDALVATPSSGDTLHLFAPSEAFLRYNLPVHQDYPYLMQSPAQVTLWMNLGSSRDAVGGCTFWAGSHKLGVTRSFKGENGHFESEISEAELAQFERLDVGCGEGDLVVAHSLVVHRSIPGRSRQHSRICQIFRFSDLEDATSRGYRWTSTSYARPTVKFEDVHSDKFVAAAPD